MAFGITTDIDMENKKLLALKKIEEDNFKQTVDKKITVSKTSVIIMILYAIICLIIFILAINR